MNEEQTISEILESEHHWLDEQFEQFQTVQSGDHVDGGLFANAAKALTVTSTWKRKSYSPRSRPKAWWDLRD